MFRQVGIHSTMDFVYVCRHYMHSNMLSTCFHNYFEGELWLVYTFMTHTQFPWNLVPNFFWGNPRTAEDFPYFHQKNRYIYIYIQGGPPTSYKWNYNPSYPFIRPFIGLITPLITGRGPPCMYIIYIYIYCVYIYIYTFQKKVGGWRICVNSHPGIFLGSQIADFDQTDGWLKNSQCFLGPQEDTETFWLVWKRNLDKAQLKLASFFHSWPFDLNGGHLPPEKVTNKAF